MEGISASRFVRVKLGQIECYSATCGWEETPLPLAFSGLTVVTLAPL